MVLNIQSQRVKMPKDLQSKLNVNPFVSGPDITEESAMYNQQQLTDALMKKSMDQDLNTQFRAPRNRDELSKADLKFDNTRGFDNVRVPKYIGAQEAVTEQEAFDYYTTMQNDQSGVWADPANYGELSRVELNAMRQDDEKNGTRNVAKGMKRFQRYLQGRSLTPDQPIDLRDTEAVRRTLRNVKKFRKAGVAQGFGDFLEPLSRPVKSLNRRKANDDKRKDRLSTDSANFLVGMVNQLEKDAGSKIDPLTGQGMKTQSESFLNNRADSDPTKVSENQNKSNWNVIEEAYGLNGENKKNKQFFTSTVVAGMTGIIDHLRMIKSDKQALSAFLTLPNASAEESVNVEMLTDEFVDDLDQDIDEELEQIAKKKDTSEIRKASLESLRKGFNVRGEQPILNSVVHRLDGFIRDNLAPGTHGNSSMAAPGSLVRWFTEQGYLSWGRTKGGYLVPVIKENYQVQNLSQNELATAYNPALRHKKYSAVNASTFPITDDFNVKYKGDWKKFLDISKDTTGRSSISRAFLSMMKSTPVSIDGDMLDILKQIYDAVVNEKLDSKFHKLLKSFNKTGQETGTQEQIQELAMDEATSMTVKELGIPPGGSTHPFAHLLGEIDAASFNLYKMRDNKADPTQDIVERKDAHGLVNQHMVTIANRLEEIIQKYEQQEKSGVKQNYLQWYKSGGTGRYFVRDALFNHINDKGLIRTVLNVGHKVPLDLNKKEFKNFNSISSLAKDVYRTGGKGLAKWEKINAKLHALPAHQRQLMGFFYTLGKTADNIGLLESSTKLNNPEAAINHGIQSFDAMANKGATYRSWLRKPGDKISSENLGALPKDTETMDAVDQNIFRKKGEWQYPLSIAMDASKLKEAIANNDNTFNFNFKFEQDARQSNAAMQSLLTGDSGVAGLLGIVEDQALMKMLNGEEVPAADLRDLIISNIDEVVDLTLNNDDPEEKQRANAVKDYFKNAEKEFGSKVVVGGLIVAGLYGKYPGYMYSEVETMLGKTNVQVTIDNVSRNVTAEIMTAYEGDPSLLQRDISQVYLQMANEHMKGLMGYQALVKSIGTMFGALDGPTEIAGFYPGENILLAIEELHNTTSEAVVGDALKREGTKVGGWFYPNLRKGRESISASPTVTSQRALEARREELIKANNEWRSGKQFGEHPSFQESMEELKTRYEEAEKRYLDSGIPIEQVDDLLLPLKQRVEAGPVLNPTVVPSALRGEEGTERYRVLGSQVSRAFPVVAIQNMDSLALGMSFMVANGNKMTPPAATAIHDAIISTADSVLLLNNAYNNIVPNVFARGGKEFLNRVVNGMWRDVVNPILRSPDDSKFNIGTEVAYSSAEAYTDSPFINSGHLEKNNMSSLRNLSGITNYFDEIHYRYIEGAKEFLSPEQKTRKKIFNNTISDVTNEQWGNYKRHMDELVLEAAKRNGWRPPGSANRSNYSVTGKDMKHLVVLMLEREGLLTEVKRDKIKKALGNSYYNVTNVDPDYSAPGLPTSMKAINNALFKMKSYAKYKKGRKALIKNLSEQTKYNSNLD